MRKSMSFIPSGNKKMKKNEKKLPPHSAWGNYRKHRHKNATSNAQSYPRTDVSTPLISVRDLSLSYDGNTVIEGLSFDIHSGDYLCIIGENGSGKSTLLSALLSLKRPKSGSIRFNELDRREIGFLPQQSNIQPDFPALVGEIVLTGCLNRSSKGPFVSKKDRAIAFANMEKLGITPLSRRAYSELSGGQKQRVLLSRAICSAQKLLVLDEPVTGLDPKSTADIYSLIEHLNRDLGITVVTVTHDLSSALGYASHILRINKGSCFFGKAEEYFALPEAEEYLTRDRTDSAEDTPYGDGGFRYTGGER